MCSLSESAFLVRICKASQLILEVKLLVWNLRNLKVRKVMVYKFVVITPRLENFMIRHNFGTEMSPQDRTGSSRW